MFSKPFAVGALALACVTAAAGGAYIAVRQNAPPASPAHSEAPANPDSTVSPAVKDTEAVVTPPPPAPEAPAVESPRRAAPEPLPVPAESRPRTPKPEPARAPARNAAARPPANPPVEAPRPAAGRPEPAPVTTPETVPAAPPVEGPRPEPPPPPPAPTFEELVVPASAVMGLQVQTAVSSERARVEDRVEARVTRDLSVDGRTAIPAGTRVVGSVTLVERGGKVKERARLGVRFHTLVMADGTERPIRTEAILREGDSPTGESSRKIGGAAVGGAILGAIIGGKKGAIVGGATGAAGGTAVVMTGDRNAATLPVGAVVTVRLSSPLTVAVEKQ